MIRAANFVEGSTESDLDRRPTDFFSDISEFCSFVWEELKPFPGRGQAVNRLIFAVLATTILTQTLRMPNGAISAFLVFIVLADTGGASLRTGLVGLLASTIAVILAMGVSICFMDAPWFRLPVTFALIGTAMWLARVLVMGIAARLTAIPLALYLSFADEIYDPESLTESTLWLWPAVALPAAISILTSFLMEPRPDRLLRAQITTSLGLVEHILAAFASGQLPPALQARALRRQLYARPQVMRQLLARWQSKNGAPDHRTIDWDIAISGVERLFTATAALALLEIPVTENRVRLLAAQSASAVGKLRQAVESHNPGAIPFIEVPSVEFLPDTPAKAAAIELLSAVADSRLVLVPPAEPENPTQVNASGAHGHLFVPDAFTNPDYSRFAYKTVLSIIACDIFMNAVDWPGIRTCLITCVITALATSGAQRQKQLLRLVGVCTGGLMGLIAVVYLVPQLDTIVGLLLVIAAGTFCCAWVGAGSVRISYAGFQMAFAFFILLLPGFSTSIDLTGIRDRFVGILVGITAMWFIFDNLWSTPSRFRVLDKLVSILGLMAESPSLVLDASASEAAKKSATFRRRLYGELESGRLLLDETKIDLTLSLDPQKVTGDKLEVIAKEISLAGLLLLTLNESKLRVLSSDVSRSLQPVIDEEDGKLARAFKRVAGLLAYTKNSDSEDPSPHREQAPIPTISASPSGADSIDQHLAPLYKSLHDCIRRIHDLGPTVEALP